MWLKSDFNLSSAGSSSERRAFFEFARACVRLLVGIFFFVLLVASYGFPNTFSWGVTNSPFLRHGQPGIILSTEFSEQRTVIPFPPSPLDLIRLLQLPPQSTD